MSTLDAIVIGNNQTENSLDKIIEKRGSLFGRIGSYLRRTGHAINSYKIKVGCVALTAAVIFGATVGKTNAKVLYVKPTQSTNSTIDNVDETIITNNRLSWANDQSNIQYPSIQAAIDAATNGDTIILARGIFTGYGNRDIDFSGKAIIVRSTDPNNPNIVATTIIDCNGAETEPHRGFYFQSGEDANSILAGITIMNGYASGSRPADHGGAIYCYGSSPTLTNCVFSGNSSKYGGGMSNNQYSNPTLINCIFSNNSASFGSGMNNYYSNPTLINCIFSNNSATMGGGMHNDYDGNPTLINCIFSNNSAKKGGGMDNDYGNPTLINCTFSNNSADRGGGMSNEGRSPTLTNCILWGDRPDEIYMDNGTAVVTYSNIQGGWLGEGNISKDPHFANPNNGDYHLKSQAGRWDPNTKTWVIDDKTSPCIDAGDPLSPIMYEPFPNGGRINMGAYGGTLEASKSYFGLPLCETIVAGDINGDCKVDFKDFAIMALHWLENKPN